MVMTPVTVGVFVPPGPPVGTRPTSSAVADRTERDADAGHGQRAGATGARPDRPAAADLEERDDAAAHDRDRSCEEDDRDEERGGVGRAGEIVWDDPAH